MTIIEQFANDSKLSKNLKVKIKEALEYNCKKTNFLWFKKHKIIDELPNDLKYELASYLHNSCTKKLFFFWDKSANFVKIYAPLLMPVFYAKGATIYEIQEPPRHVYMINEGRINFLSQDELIFKTFINGS